LTACHVLNRIPIKNKDITLFKEWEKKRVNLSYLRTWGCLAKVNVPINKKRKQIVDCIFIGYAFHSIGYRFLIIKSGVHDMHVGTIMDSSDATFFEDIFPMREDYCSTSQNSIINNKPTEMIEHNEQTLMKNLCVDNETSKKNKRKICVVTMKLLKRARDKGLQSPLVMILLRIFWMILLQPLKKHIHLLMLTTGRKQSRGC
jgi:hypothetical protein